MRTNYVLIDFENVQPDSLVGLQQDHFKVLVFVGANQTKVPFDVAQAMQAMGAKAEYVKIAGNGSNALDFHIAFYIGQLAAADPTAFFHIISKDTGFDPLIAHLKAKKIFAARETSISEIPLIKTAVTKTPDERLQIVLEKLRLPKATKPRTLKTLASHINSQFQKQLSESDVANSSPLCRKPAILQSLTVKSLTISRHLRNPLRFSRLTIRVRRGVGAPL